MSLFCLQCFSGLHKYQQLVRVGCEGKVKRTWNIGLCLVQGNYKCGRTLMKRQITWWYKQDNVAPITFNANSQNPTFDSLERSFIHWKTLALQHVPQLLQGGRMSSHVKGLLQGANFSALEKYLAALLPSLHSADSTEKRTKLTTGKYSAVEYERTKELAL